MIFVISPADYCQLREELNGMIKISSFPDFAPVRDAVERHSFVPMKEPRNGTDLVRKYNVPAPRYTSYPTVPYWDTEFFDDKKWELSLARCLEKNGPGGISLYIHLPFCESLCTYCGCNKRITRNHVHERPYIEALLKEWRLYLRLLGSAPLIGEIHLGGGTPTFFDPGNLRLLIEGLLRDAEVQDQASFSFESHPGNTTKDHLQTLHELGFRRVSLGIQDFDPRVQQIINRVQSYRQVETVTSQARAAGYTSVNFDLIYGLPLQRPSGLKATIAQVRELFPDRIAFYSYAHVPWNAPGQRHYTTADLPSAEEKQTLYELGRDRFLASGYHEIGMDHFALPRDSLYQAMIDGRLHRNFMGYTDRRTHLLIGLGVSSISDSWFAFSQNEKKLENYYARLAEDRLPLMKGHALTGEDLIIRRHILELMCSGYTIFNNSSPCFTRVAEGLKRMRPMEADGLVAFSGNRLDVLPDGKRFLRNICMALDARLWAKLPATQLFSMSV